MSVFSYRLIVFVEGNDLKNVFSFFIFVVNTIMICFIFRNRDWLCDQFKECYNESGKIVNFQVVGILWFFIVWNRKFIELFVGNDQFLMFWNVVFFLFSYLFQGNKEMYIFFYMLELVKLGFYMVFFVF